MTQTIRTLTYPRKRYQALSAHRGYFAPALAVAGSSDTGTWEDSPCPTPLVKAELKRIRNECLAPAGIRSILRSGNTSNLFCGKLWLTVAREDYAKAAKLALDWLDRNKSSTRFIHDAGQGVYFPEEAR